MIRVPEVGESISEVEIGEWLRSEGDSVARDEPIVVIETDKITVELPAPVSGTLTQVLKQAGEAATVGELIGIMEESATPSGEDGGEAPPAEKPARAADTKPEPVAVAAAPGGGGGDGDGGGEGDGASDGSKLRVTPTAARIMAEHDLQPGEVQATGAGGRVLKEDVLRALSARVAPAPTVSGDRREEIVPMSPLRRRVAERLVRSQHEAAILTTFNEIDMSRVIALRRKFKEKFLERYDVKLGFMSFFVKATIEALKTVPQLNAEIRGTDIVYRDYYDIGIAVGGGKGLVVPILRDAERLSFAQVELAIADLATRAQANQLTLDELQGGTFTISNGGVYGSLLSTPIINPPQSGILGLHKIEERPVALEGKVVIRPMMYVAVSYDHRIVDGREAVTFLVRIKEVIEDPERILLEV